ncbi:MAG: arginase [Flavobacteriales bacterium]|nr:arginase [Flavobacteriales bacterium]MDW8432236.1 arginase [Flavobacteriales bacterium]
MGAKKIKFIEVKSELGAGTRGASLGPDALKIVSLEYPGYFFGKFKRKEIRDSSRLLYKNPIRSYAKRIRGIVEIFRKLTRTMAEELLDDKFPVVLSGDHSSAGGTIAGIRVAYPEKRLGVIWIDAHADLHSPFTTPSGNVHGMPVAVSLGIDNLPDAQNRLENDHTVEYWETLKNMGGICPKIQPSDLVFIGLRDMEKPEENYIRDNKIKVVTVADIRKGKIKEICNQVRRYLSHCDALYISFDVDVLDSSIVKGTGTPVPNGLSLSEVKKILENLCKDKRLVCFEITEINPLLDQNNQTARLVFPVFKSTVMAIKKRLENEEKKRRKQERKALKAARELIQAGMHPTPDPAETART